MGCQLLSHVLIYQFSSRPYHSATDNCEPGIKNHSQSHSVNLDQVMASPQVKTRKLTAHEIIALSDEKLDRYLEEFIRSNCCQFGYVDVDDLQNEQKDFILKFKQRLK